MMQDNAHENRAPKDCEFKPGSFDGGQNRCLNHWRSAGSENDENEETDDLEKLLSSLSSMD